ncbi:TM2 domain-containing protein [Lutibacter maritimus]|uniref:TM2 domain-containing protein n=1 Tax=Lutibacter maritimus TaxID=593133 RepID=A0A1I6S195_9FLAO|nr:TM2 domain-containing protein [Lutibacter maritimus]SFS70640.1 TM2 domain-containing protein [Lutibacter maritimus]
MKLKIILSLVSFLLIASFSYASFPVKRVATFENSSQVNKTSATEVLVSPAAVGSEKSQGIALLLGILLGGLAGHKWYLGNPWYINVLFIITLGGLGIWWIIDMIRIITGDYKPHNGSYKADFF